MTKGLKISVKAWGLLQNMLQENSLTLKGAEIFIWKEGMIIIEGGTLE